MAFLQIKSVLPLEAGRTPSDFLGGFFLGAFNFAFFLRLLAIIETNRRG